MRDPKKINPENPDKLRNIRISEVKKVAAGLPAVESTVSHVLREMNPIRGYKALQNLNQVKGYSCPSCAWADPDTHRSKLGEYCENGAKAVAEEATTKKVDADFFKKYSVADLSQWDDFTLSEKGRLSQPMYLAADADHYQAITWDQAFQKIAQHLHGLENPDEAIFYTSGRTSNEAAFLYQLFVRALGTNNLPDCSNMCHESSGVALGESLGIGKGSVTLEDFAEAEAILILGQNPGTNHPRMLTALAQAHENGCFIASINPLPETGLHAFANPQTVSGLMGKRQAIESLHIPVRINGDLPLLQAINKMLLLAEEENPGRVLDQEFIDQSCHGYEQYKSHILGLDLESLALESGLELNTISALVDNIKFKNKIIICWAMGLTQHKNSVDTIKELVNTLLLKGSIGKSGAGSCPVRGHSNVQGDRTMGIYEKPWPWLLDALDENFGIKSPRKNGLDVVDSILAMKEGKAKFFMAMGGNFLSATPDTLFTAEALRNCDLTVQISTKLNRSHLITGEEALILPVLGRSDMDIQGEIPQFVSVENTMGVVQRSQGMLTPVSDQLKSEVELICHLAQYVLEENIELKWSDYMHDYDIIRDMIEATIPGFENYNMRVREYGGFYLPNSARERKFPTSTAKANFNIAFNEEIKLKENEFLMMTIRSHDQFNTTIYGYNDRYRGIHNERRVLLMNEEDMLNMGLKKKDKVDIYNKEGGVERVARNFVLVPYDIPRGCLASYFPETNVLVPISSRADKSNTPRSKSVIVELREVDQ